MGINPIIWGPCAWVFLHTVGREFDSSTTRDPQHAIALLEVLGDILPCPVCARNFKAYTKKTPWNPTTTSLAAWFFDAHKSKRIEQNKTSFASFVDFESSFDDKRCGRTDQRSPYYGDSTASTSFKCLNVNLSSQQNIGLTIVVFICSIVLGWLWGIKFHFTSFSFRGKKNKRLRRKRKQKAT
jgi:hypothetical protein